MFHRPKKTALSVFAAVLAAALAAPVVMADCTYSWQSVPNPGSGQYCIGTCINNLGAVAGYIETGGDTTSAFTWSPGAGRAQLPFPPGIIDMKAYGINDLGHVAGTMTSTTSWYGFLWDGQNYTVINLPTWANMLYVAGLNEDDEIVGTLLNNSTGPLRPFVWQDGVFTELGEPTGSPVALGNAINDVGRIVGLAEDAQIRRHAFTIASDHSLEWLPEPAGVTYSDALGLNNNGLIVGFGAGSGYFRRAIVWASDATYAVAPPPGQVSANFTGVNDGGRAAGYYHDYQAAYTIPIAWQHGLATDLRPLITPALPGLSSIHAINRIGQIVAHDNQGTAVLNPHWLTGDLTGDCHVGLDDLVILLSQFGSPSGSFPQGDVNGDGQVNLADLTLLLSSWGD